MAMGKRKEKQRSFWVETTHLEGPGQHPFYSRLNEILGQARFDYSRGADLSEVLHGGGGVAVDGSGRVFPLLSHRLFRGNRFRAGDRLRGSGFPAPARVPRLEPGGADAGSFDTVQDAANAEFLDAQGGVPLGVEAAR